MIIVTQWYADARLLSGVPRPRYLRSAWPFVLAVIVLDFVFYIQHVLFHAVPLFWQAGHGMFNGQYTFNR
jgi:sterol desaturase/sphingolipid hydroxylase (fatty acid hydroxylase superfamily)